MSEIQNNQGSISGSVEGTGSVNGGSVTPNEVVKGGTIARNLGGTRDYEMLENLPMVNGETLKGDKDSFELHIVGCKTTAQWAELTTLVSKKGEIYIYSDASEDAQGNPVPMAKFGDGNAYVVDLPFATAIDMRITQADIENWNNKVAVREEDGRLIFY